MSNPSLEPRDTGVYSSLSTTFKQKHPGSYPPKAVWEPSDGGCKLMNAETNVPARIVIPPDTVRVFYDEKKLTVHLSFPAATLSDPSSPLHYLHGIFGPGGSMAAALAKAAKSRAEVPKKLKSGTKMAEFIDGELGRPSGRPELVPQPLKPREDDDGNAYYSLSVKAYVSGSVPLKEPRADGAPPVEIKADMSSTHPIYTYFAENPAAVPSSSFSVTCASGGATRWQILDAITREGAKQPYGMCLASVELGGISFYWNPTHKAYFAHMYLNGAGLRVYAVPAAISDAGGVVDDGDMSVYAAACPAPTGDDDVYAQTCSKRAAVIDSDDDSEGSPAKRARNA